MLPELAAALLLIGLAAYVVLGGAERGALVRAWVKRGMSPVWEANHVWLIFVLVVLWTAFPEAFGSIMSTLAIPLFLAAREVPVGNAAGDEWGSWTGALPILTGLIAVATGAHLAAVFLGADARRAGRPEPVHAFRTRALGSGVVAGALAIAGLAVASSDSPDLYDGLVSGAGLACVIGSAAGRLLTPLPRGRGRLG